jgi:hypothetical protein
MNKIIEKIQNKLSYSNILEELAEKLSFSELNSFLMELFRIKVKTIKPSGIVHQFRNNRFVYPSEVDTLQMRKTELEYMTYISVKGYKPVTLSPLAPLGTCSLMGYVDQNNVISTIRGVEIVSDATNVLALKIVEDQQNDRDKDSIYRYVTAHRHVRGQIPPNPEYSAHFSLICLASGGYDTGDFKFELNQLNEHITIIYTLLSEKYGTDNLLLRFYLKKDSKYFREKITMGREFFWNDKNVEIIEDQDKGYYRLLQFKIFFISNETKYDLADGGFVDWTQRFTGNKKLRLMISGIGVELIYKLDPSSF